jgi:hypothetical protein
LQLATARAKHTVSSDVSSSSIALRKGTRAVAARIPLPERKAEMILEAVAAIGERSEAPRRALEVYRQNMDPVVPLKGRIVETYI